MVQHIDEDFLEDEQQYRHAEGFWRELWERLVREAGVTEHWQSPWLGAPLRDGDPIFSAVATALGRGVHIIQHEPTRDEMELVWWVDRFGEEGVDAMIDQLVISCALSVEAAARAYQLISSWVSRGTVEAADPCPDPNPDVVSR